MKQFNGVWFDEEVVTSYMQEQSCINPAIIASGAIMSDPTIRSYLGEKGNVGTMPLFLPVDAEPDALNNDGKTNNVPTEIANNKQTFMAISRMKAWKERDFIKYLTGESPLQNFANQLLVAYYTIQWNRDILAIIRGVMGVAEMASHITSVPFNSNFNIYTSIADLKQKANGDMADGYALAFMNSFLYNELVKMAVIEFKKYTVPNSLETVNVAYIGNTVVINVDEGTSEINGSATTYKCYLLGRGAVLTADKDLAYQYEVARDPETNGGESKLYTKQAKVLHPNGFNILSANIVEESPTRSELGTSANWSVAFQNLKNILIAELDVVVG